MLQISPRRLEHGDLVQADSGERWRVVRVIALATRGNYRVQYSYADPIGIPPPVPGAQAARRPDTFMQDYEPGELVWLVRAHEQELPGPIREPDPPPGTFRPHTEPEPPLPPGYDLGGGHP